MRIYFVAFRWTFFNSCMSWARIGLTVYRTWIQPCYNKRGSWVKIFLLREYWAVVVLLLLLQKLQIFGRLKGTKDSAFRNSRQHREHLWNGVTKLLKIGTKTIPQISMYCQGPYWVTVRDRVKCFSNREWMIDGVQNHYTSQPAMFVTQLIIYRC